MSFRQAEGMIMGGVRRRARREIAVAAAPVVTAVERAQDALGAPELWRVTVERQHRRIAAGILTPDDRVELLDGFLVRKMARSPRHS